MKKKKKITSVLIASCLSSIAIVSGINYIIQNDNKNLLSKKNINNEIDLSNYKRTSNLNDAFISGNVTPNTSGELVLPQGKRIQVSNAYEMQKITPVPGGWIVPTQGNGGEDVSFINENDNTIKWTNSTDVSHNSKIITSQYDKTTNKVIVLRCINNYSLYVYALDPNNGNVTSKSIVYQAHDQNWLLNQRFDMVKIEKTDSKWLMMPRAIMTNSERFDSRTKIITFTGSNFIVESVPNLGYERDSYAVMSYGAYFNPTINKIEVVLAEWIQYSKVAFFYKYCIGDNSRSRYAGMFESTSDVFTDSNKLSWVCSRLKINQNGNDSLGSFYVTFLYNTTPWSQNKDVGFYNTVIFSRPNRNIFNKIQKIDLNTSGSNGCDIDINNPYLYDGNYYGMASYFSNARSGILISGSSSYIGGAIRITSRSHDDGASYYGSKYANWDKNNPDATQDAIKIYTKGIKAFNANNLSRQFVIPSYNGNYWGSFEFNGGYYAMASALSLSNYSLRQEEKLGRYAYWTRNKKNNEDGLISKNSNEKYFRINLRVDNVSNQSAFDCTERMVTETISNSLLQKSSQFSSNIRWKVDPSSIQDQDNNLPQGTKWSYYFYKGIAPFSVSLKKIFIEGCYTNDLIGYAMMSGFKQWTTSLKPNISIDANTAGLERYTAEDLQNNLNGSKEILASYIRQNINHIFNDFPIESDFNPVQDISIDVTNANDDTKTADVIIHTNKWINDTHELQSSNKTWTVPITGFRDPIKCVSEISWNNLVGTMPPTVQEIISGLKNDIIRQAMYRPYHGKFFLNQNNLNIKPDEISIDSIEPIKNNNTKVKINFSTRLVNLTTIISELRQPNTTLNNVINANRPSEFPSIQTVNKLLTILNENKTKAFTNLPTGWEVNEKNVRISNIRPDDANGIVVATVTLLNINSITSSLTMNVKFTNFKNSTNSTLLNETTFRINGIDDILASTLINLNNNYDKSIIKIKRAIKNNISNANGMVTLNDIELIKVSANDTDGTLKVKVKLINNKFLSNGNPIQTHEFSSLISILGFKTTAATKWTDNNQIQDNASFNQIVASQYGQEQITNYVWDHKNQFFTHEPETLVKTDLVISAISPDNTNGTVQFTLGLKKYNNDKGQLIENISGESFKKRFILSGFKSSLNTTFIPYKIILNGLSTIDPNSIDFSNQSDILMIQIKREIIKVISNPASQVNSQDIVLSKKGVNQAEGSILVDIMLKNNKYQSQGSVSEYHVFSNITLYGFKATNINHNGTSLKKTIITPEELGISRWYIDFNQDEVMIKIKKIINTKINEYFYNPVASTQVSTVSFGSIDKNGYVLSTITFNGNNNGQQDNNMVETIKIGKLLQKDYISLFINSKIKQIIKDIVDNSRDANNDSLNYLVKQEIIKTINNHQKDLPFALFDQGLLTLNDIELFSIYRNNSFDIFINSIKRLGGIQLCIGEFKKSTVVLDFKSKDKMWLIYIISGGCIIFIATIALLFYINTIKRKKIEK